MGALGAARPAAAPSTRVPHDLPPLIGRDPEMLTLQALLARHRVVTVVDPGGVGKTRLALAAAMLAQQQADAGAGPVHLIELAGAAEGAPVAEAVARALGIGLAGLQAVPAELVDVLETRDLLLVLDNCEHRLTEVGELVEALARHAPRVRVLATSQQPLAIELAAARLQLLGLAGLRQRLGEHLRVLADGQGRERELRPERQRTLRAAIEWSHALLNADERHVFRRLSVFAGSFSLAAADAVAADPADGDTDALDPL